MKKVFALENQHANEADRGIEGNDSTKEDQAFLGDANPWRVADSRKDGLHIVLAL